MQRAKRVQLGGLTLCSNAFSPDAPPGESTGRLGFLWGLTDTYFPCQVTLKHKPASWFGAFHRSTPVWRATEKADLRFLDSRSTEHLRQRLVLPFETVLARALPVAESNVFISLTASPLNIQTVPQPVLGLSVAVKDGCAGEGDHFIWWWVSALKGPTSTLTEGSQTGGRIWLKKKKTDVLRCLNLDAGRQGRFPLGPMISCVYYLPAPAQDWHPGEDAESHREGAPGEVRVEPGLRTPRPGQDCSLSTAKPQAMEQ